MTSEARAQALKLQKMREREKKFDTSFHLGKLPKYDPLLDRNLRHHFENPRLQRQLHRMGLIDREGRVIDMEKYKSKIVIIEQEFRRAEEAEQKRIKEEEEMRERVRKKRFDALDRQRRMERLQRIKEDRRIRRDMLRVTLESRSGAVGSPFFGGSGEDDVASFGPEEDDFEQFAGDAGADESRAWAAEAGRRASDDEADA